MYQRFLISFQADDEILRGLLYQPNITPAPCIIMTHGFTATIKHHLLPFAELFAQAGFCVLLYDHRNCGISTGEPRYEINPKTQINDYSHAITYALSLPIVKAGSIGIWGTSYSGGHVLVVAANDKRVKSVVTQVPFIKGHHNYLKQKYPEKWLTILKLYEEDQLNRALGKAPQKIPVVSLDK
jgi:cephalosporin-C deacetylase-like acetyl esterase